MKAINLNNIAFSNIPRFDYRCVIKGISKSKVVNSLPKSELNGKMEHCKVQFFFNLSKKMSKEIKTFSHKNLIEIFNKNSTVKNIDFFRMEILIAY